MFGSRLQTFYIMALLFIGTKENSVELLKNKSAKSRGLSGNVGYVCAWFAWVRGCVSCVGQIFAWVQFFFTWVKIFYVGHFFSCVSQLLFTSRDYFTILQLIV